MPAAEHAFGLGRADLVDQLVTGAGDCALSASDRARMEWLREIFNDGADQVERSAGTRQLYLSPRTVGSILYRLFPKLGITSRTQLAATSVAVMPHR